MFFKNIEVSGIRKIVINRQIVWELDAGCEGDPVWRKTAGGPGFNVDDAAGSRRATKFPNEMKMIVDHLLERQVVTGHWQGHEVVDEQYRAWVHGDTLNIVLRKFERKTISVVRGD